MRAFLRFGDIWCIELRSGTTIIGRDPSCHVPLQDDAASRRHMRLVLDRRTVTALDLGSTNGTRLNGAPLEQARKLGDGDQLLIGHSLCSVHLLDDADLRIAELAALSDRPPPDQATTVHPTTATCSLCLRPIPPECQECPNCRPPAAAERRRDPRVRTSLPIRLSESARTIVATSHDVSLGGIFVVGSHQAALGPCEVTLLPEEAQPMMARGVVRHVIAEPMSDGHPAGIGIKFTEMERRTWLWIQDQLAHHEDPSFFGDSSSP